MKLGRHQTNQNPKILLIVFLHLCSYAFSRESQNPNHVVYKSSDFILRHIGIHKTENSCLRTIWKLISHQTHSRKISTIKRSEQNNSSANHHTMTEPTLHRLYTNSNQDTC